MLSRYRSYRIRSPPHRRPHLRFPEKHLLSVSAALRLMPQSLLPGKSEPEYLRRFHLLFRAGYPSRSHHRRQAAPHCLNRLPMSSLNCAGLLPQTPPQSNLPGKNPLHCCPYPGNCLSEPPFSLTALHLPLSHRPEASGRLPRHSPEQPEDPHILPGGYHLSPLL